MVVPAFASSSPVISRRRWGCHVCASPERRAVAVRASRVQMSVSGKDVLVIGGTRFSGLYLVHALHAAGAGSVTLLNRGSKAPTDESLAVPGESMTDFQARALKTDQLIADRTDASALKSALSGKKYDVIYDNNGRELSDSAPLADLAAAMDAHFVYMSSAGVYKKSPVMPHIEGDEVDQACRHKGKLDTEGYLAGLSGLRWTAVRPTYIYGAMNYNPVEQWFFERVAAGRPVCVPGHGMHLTGLGHVRDLARLFVAVADNPVSYGQVYNAQDAVAVTFDGVAKMCAEAAGAPEPEIVHYNPKDYDFGKKKAFPFRPQHFFTSPSKALAELDWTIEYDLKKGLKDAFENDFLSKKANGKLKNDFTTDEMILEKVKGAAAAL